LNSGAQQKRATGEPSVALILIKLHLPGKKTGYLESTVEMIRFYPSMKFRLGVEKCDLKVPR
jgi:hypothetical protein